MNIPERFQRAITRLVNAYFSGNLIKGSCRKCAVGNIIGEQVTDDWYGFVLSKDDKVKDFERYCPLSREIAVTQIAETGYSIAEIIRIEEAFENNTRLLYSLSLRVTKQRIMEDQLNGLLAVVDVLCKIEGLPTNPYKELFSYTEEFTPKVQLLEVF